MKRKFFSLISLVGLPIVVSLPILTSCSSVTSHTVTEQEFIDAINLKDVQCIQRIQQTNTTTLTWQIAPNICHEIEEKADSFVERYTIPKPGVENIWITKKRTSKTETNWTIEENNYMKWYKTVDSDDVKPIKLLQKIGEGIFDNFKKYTFENPINIYSANHWENDTCNLATLQFTNKKVTYLKIQSLSGSLSFGEKFEFRYENIIPVYPK